MADIPLFPNGADFDNQQLINLADATTATGAATLQQVKSLIQGQIQGAYNANTNSPDLTTPAPGTITAGMKWVVSVAGTALHGLDLQVGDVVIAIINDPAGASDWLAIEGNITDSDDIIEGSVNLFVTADQKDALNNAATAATAANPLVTVADLPAAQDLAATLAVGNTSGANNLQMSGTTQLQFGSTADHIESDGSGNIDYTTAGIHNFNTTDGITSINPLGNLLTEKVSTGEAFLVNPGAGILGRSVGAVNVRIDFKSLPTASRVIQVPDNSGVIALTSDIPGAQNLNNVLGVGNSTSGEDMRLTEGDKMEFGSASTYFETAGAGSKFNAVAGGGFLFTGANVSAGWGQSDFEVKRISTDDGIILSPVSQQIGFDNTGTFTSQLTASAATAARTWTLPDATGTIALTTDIPVVPTNDGKVKINGSGGVKPSYAVASGVDQIVDYGVSALDLSLAPTTEFPQNVSNPTDSDIWDSVNGTLIENTILGQQHLWRVIINYSGKPTGTSSIDSMDIIIRNTLSGFEAVDSYTLPRNQSAESNRQFLISTIADGASLPPPFGTGQGYELIINSNIAMTVEIESVTRISLHHNPR